MGLRCTHLFEGFPLRSCGAAHSDLLEDALCERHDDVAEDLLVKHQLGRVRQVQHLGVVLAYNLLRRSWRAPVDETDELGSTDRRKNLELPQGIVGFGELFSHGVTEGGWKGAGGARHGKELEDGRLDLFRGIGSNDHVK